MNDPKQQAALAAVKLINEGHTVGFGAGSTIAHMVNGIVAIPGLRERITTVTSSFSTRLLLEQSGFAVVEMGALTAIDLYFDGCDQFDKHLSALKSGGGIHTREKVLASMAERFVLIGDASKRVDALDGKYPLVVEVLPISLRFAEARLKALFPGVRCDLRMAAKKDGAVITEQGNYLIDCLFEVFPSPERVNDLVGDIAGVVEHSLFYRLAKLAIVGGSGGIEYIEAC